MALAAQVGTYLYEPNASILKAGAFKSVARQYGLEKLQVSSHLYTSNSLVGGFPGRTFQIEKVFPFSNKVCKSITQEIPQANITVRNFPMSVDDLRKKTKIQEGGDVYLFATTLSDGGKVLVVCRKVSNI